MERASVANYDRIMGNLDGRPDVTKTKPTTLRALSPIVGAAETFIVQTFRVSEPAADGEPGRSGDTVFIEYLSAEMALRIVLPAEATACIARQRDALTGRIRSRTAKRVAGERKARGELPGFMKAGKRGGRKRKPGPPAGGR